jgi:hypothetical protein
LVLRVLSSKFDTLLSMPEGKFWLRGWNILFDEQSELCCCFSFLLGLISFWNRFPRF